MDARRPRLRPMPRPRPTPRPRPMLGPMPRPKPRPRPTPKPRPPTRDEADLECRGEMSVTLHSINCSPSHYDHFYALEPIDSTIEGGLERTHAMWPFFPFVLFHYDETFVATGSNAIDEIKCPLHPLKESRVDQRLGIKPGKLPRMAIQENHLEIAISSGCHPKIVVFISHGVNWPHHIALSLSLLCFALEGVEGEPTHSLRGRLASDEAIRREAGPHPKSNKFAKTFPAEDHKTG